MTQKKNTDQKALKDQSLRNNEYYDTQPIFDKLYSDSKNDKIFTDLLSIITSDNNLLLAFRNIKRNKGSQTPGVNKHTIDKWSKATVKQYLKYFRNRFINYIASPVRRVEIPKPNGKKRPLGIPTIEDRLIQQSIKQVLEPICEAKFYEHSYGFRPNRSTEHAINYVMLKINKGGCKYVVDVDIQGFFDNVDHGKLLKQIWAMGIHDKNLLCIISKMLKAPIVINGKETVSTKGTPQGGILSPLLSNIVLNELDWWIAKQWVYIESLTKPFQYNITKQGRLNRSNKYKALRNKSKLKEIYIVRYADDFKILCKTRDEAERIYIATQQWLKERLNLNISPDKSGITNIRKKRTEFLGFNLKAHPKRNKYIIQSHVCDKAKGRIQQNLSKAILDIHKHPSHKTVGKYNSMVLGMQNYYRIATQISRDFGTIAYILSKKLHNQLKNISSDTGTLTDFYKKQYKNNYKVIFVASTALFPLADIRTKNALGFNHICKYTEEGRSIIHRKLAYINPQIIKYLVTNPPEYESVLFYDNRLSLFSAQKGLSGITKEVLTIGNMEVHRILPKEMGGSDNYRNLIYLTSGEHRLVHNTTNGWTMGDIRMLEDKIIQDEGMFRSLNTLRVKAGNRAIGLTDKQWYINII